MSQVIVTDDQLKTKRLATAQEESRIDTNSQFNKWLMSDVTKPNHALKLIGLAALPIVALWGLLLACIGAALGLTVYLLKALGSIFRRRS